MIDAKRADGAAWQGCVNVPDCSAPAIGQQDFYAESY